MPDTPIMPHAASIQRALQTAGTKLLAGVAVLGCALVLSGSQPPTTLQQVLAAGELRVLSKNGPATFYDGPHGRTGLEYELLSGLAEELGVKLVIEEEESLSHMLDAVHNRRAHLAAAGLTVTDKRQRKVRFNRPYQEVVEKLIYHSRAEAPQRIEDLLDKEILVIAGSSHAERLAKLQREHPELRWHEREQLEMIDLMAMVHRGEVDYAIVDSNAYEFNRRIYPRARAAFSLGEPQSLAWAFPPGSDNSLFDKADAYLERVSADGTLTQLKGRLHEQIAEVSLGGSLLFSRRLEERLPQWEGQLREAAESVDLDWQLLAALSYQESHWDPNARSHTGVRGLMMLTQNTARDLGIDNRLDPEQSIRGGARYLRDLYERLPAGVQGEDRTWMALAAYNIGLGHLEDARVITQRHGADPNSWEAVRDHLPLLAEPQHYRNTRYGYARGWEPVTYVRNIRNFYAIISWHDERERHLIALGERDTGGDGDTGASANSPFSLMSAL